MSTIPVDAVSEPDPKPADAPVRLVLSPSDLAERRGVMAALDTSQCLVWFDDTGRVIDVNAKFQDLLGRSRPELLDLTYGDLVGEEDPTNHHLRLRWERIVTGQLGAEERGVYTRSGDEIWSSITFAPVPDATGYVQRVLAIVIDLTPWSWRNDKPSRSF